MFESFNDFTNNGMPLNEGMFSFKTLGDNKAISARSGADIYMFDDKGNMWHEENYEGYGEFGGKDFFELMAEMNGGEGRDAGIDFYYSDDKKVLYPALTRDKDFNWKRHKFTTKIKSDPKQGWFYESVVNEIQHGGTQWKQMDRMVRDSDKEALGKSLGKIFRALLDEYDYDEIWDYTVSIFKSPKYYRMLESFDATLELNEASVAFTADQLNGLHRILVLKMDQSERIADVYGYTLNTMLSDYIKRAESKPGNRTAVKVDNKLANAMNQLLSNNDNHLSSDDEAYVRSKISKMVTESTNEDMNEAKSINKIQKEWGNVTAIMKDTVAKYKKAEGQEKEDLLDELKSLTASKKQLEAELDAAVGLKDIDAELAEGMSTETIDESIKAEDIKPGAEFKIKGGTVFRVDDVEDHKKQGLIVHSSRSDADKKNAYRDSLDDFVEFLNYEKAKVLENSTESRGAIELVSESYNELNERTVTLKRRYTENYPAVTAGKSARIRNKMLEAIADGKITQEEFNTILKEMSNHPGKWSRRNAKYFNVSEDGISLSKFGKKALKQITINEDDMNEARENWIVYTGQAMKKFYSEHTGKKSAEKMVDMASRVLNQVGMMTKSEWEKEKEAGNVMENTKFVFESFSEFESNTINEGAFVVWYEDKEGKHLLGTFHNKKAADKYKSEEEDEVLNTVGIKAIGTMSKDMWDKKEAPYIKEAAKIKMNALDWGKTTAERNANQDKYDALETEEDREEFLRQLKNESVVNEGKHDAMLDQLAELVKDVDFINVGIKLKEAGIKYDFSTGMMPMYKLAKYPIAIVNKKYVDKGDREVGDIAIGVLESVDTEGTELVAEAFQSSKLRNLLTMGGADGRAVKNLAQAFYGLTKYKLDELPDAALRDVDTQTAYKSYQKDKEFAVFYIVDNEKENPYGDSDWESKIKPGIIAITRGKDFLGASYPSRNAGSTLTTNAQPMGGDKRYSGYGATGIYNVKRAAELADRAIVVWLNNDVFKSNDQVQQRADAKSGAIAFKSDADFKKANMSRYREILANKASKLPLDKIVEGAIEELSKQIKDGLSQGEKGRYGDIIIGRNKKGNEVRLRDASNHMSNILDDYNRYVDYMSQAEKDKESGYSSGYYEKESKQYAKNISDKVRQIKSFDYAW